MVAAALAINDIQHLSKLSLRTAMTLFRVKVQPVISYGLHLIWEHLSASNLQCIEKIKATYLKRVLCLSKYTRSRLVYEMCRELSLLEEFRLNLLLPSTSAYEEAIRIHEGKKAEIWSDFYATDATTGKEWAEANYELRHLVTRYAAHGFHHKLCRTKHFHQPTEDCVCSLCEKQCERYHAEKCTKRNISMTQFCSD